jgi:hypothetical protein
MKNNFPFRHALLLLGALGLAGPAQAATLTRTILDDGSTVSLYNPSVALGSDGTLHVVAQGRDPATFSSASVEIYYLSYGPGGTVRAATQINAADADNEGRAKLALTADGKVVVTWAGNTQSMKAVLLNPAADPADLIEVAETVIGANNISGHHALAIDGNGKAHVVRTTGSAMLHIRFDPATLVADVPEHAIGSATGSTRQVDAGLGIDANDRLHIVYSASDVDSEGPAAYMMTDDTGTILIAPTALFERAGAYAHAAHFSLVVDSPNLVHVVYGDKRNTVAFNNWSDFKSGGTAFYARLNPSLDDQSGDAATLATIRVGADTTIGGYWYGQAFLSSGMLHFLTGTGTGGTGDLVHVALNPGTGAAGEPRTFTAQNGGHSIGKRFVRGAGSHVVWAEEIYSPTLTGATTQIVRADLGAVSARPVLVDDDDGWFGCTLSTGKAPVDPLLPLLAVLAGLYLVRRRIFPAGL